MAWTSPEKTRLDLSKPKPPPLPAKGYLSLRERAIMALNTANYQIYKDLWCSCCSGKYHPVVIEPDVSYLQIKKMLREKSVLWCKRCLDFCPTALKKHQNKKRFCRRCNSFLFDGDLTPNVTVFKT